MRRAFLGSIALIALMTGVPAPAGAQSGHGSKEMHGHPAPAKGDQAEIAGKGVINAVDAPGRSVNLSHEPIPAIGWPSMTMDMKVADGIDLSKLKKGDAVTFQLDRGGDGIYMIRSMDVSR